MHHCSIGICFHIDRLPLLHCHASQVRCSSWLAASLPGIGPWRIHAVRSVYFCRLVGALPWHRRSHKGRLPVLQVLLHLLPLGGRLDQCCSWLMLLFILPAGVCACCKGGLHHVQELSRCWPIIGNPLGACGDNMLKVRAVLRPAPCSMRCLSRSTAAYQKAHNAAGCAL